MINFPSSPAPGDEFAVDGHAWRWDGIVWTPLAGASSPPAGGTAALGDVLLSCQSLPPAGYVQAGAVYAQADYPALFGMLGSLRPVVYAEYEELSLPLTHFYECDLRVNGPNVAAYQEILDPDTNELLVVSAVVSPDGGQTWRNIALPEDATIFNVYMTNGGGLFAYEQSGQSMFSSNDGASWSYVQLPVNWMYFEQFTNVGNTIYAVGWNVNTNVWGLLRTNDNGASWSLVPFDPPPQYLPAEQRPKLLFATSEKLYLNNLNSSNIGVLDVATGTWDEAGVGNPGQEFYPQAMCEIGGIKYVVFYKITPQNNVFLLRPLGVTGQAVSFVADVGGVIGVSAGKLFVNTNGYARSPYGVYAVDLESLPLYNDATHFYVPQAGQVRPPFKAWVKAVP